MSFDASRRAKLALNMNQVAALLNLPEDLRVVGVYTTTDPDYLYVKLVGDRFEPVPIDVEAPVVRFSELAE